MPVTGPATFRAGDPPRESVVTFSAEVGQRSVEMPMRAALPVLTRAHTRDDLHPSVGLLSGAALLGLRLVAAGKLRPAESGTSWRVAPLEDGDVDRVRRLAEARAPDDLDAEQARGVVRAVLDAVADAVPRAAPATPLGRRLVPASARGSEGGSAPGFEVRLQQRLERLRGGASRPDEDDAHLVRLTLRVEAAEEELLAGAVRLVLQVHDERDPLHFCDAAQLWQEAGPDASHGFGQRARTHTGIALRAAAEAWPVLDRFLEARVPDQITLDGDEISGLLEDGVAALASRGIDVLWPRSLGRELTATAVLDRVEPPDPRHPRDREPPTGPGFHEEPLQEPLLGHDSVFAFRWQLALGGQSLTEEEMDQLAAAASPLLRLRGAWMVVDPASARRARRRLLRNVKPAPALAAALTGSVQLDPAGLGTGPADEPPLETPVVVGASLLRVRERLLAAATAEPVEVPPALRAELRGYQRQGLTWLSELTSLGLGACLADDMGLGKTVTLIALHLHRTALGSTPGSPQGATGPTLVVCPASLLGNWEAEIRRFAPGAEVRRFHAGRRSLDGLEIGASAERGFVLTTYGTMRRDARELGSVPWDLVVADEAQHVKNPRSSTARALRTIESRGRVALTGTPVENDLSELWAILDWATPGLLGSRNAFRKRWAARIESGREPAVARQFADLIGPFLLRRRKSDPGVAPELPAKTETDHPLRLTPEQVVLYESYCRDTLERIELLERDETARRGLVLALLTGLKQICNHPAHFLKQASGPLRGRSEKLELLDELLATVLAEGGAMLVFTQYVAMARLLERHLAAAGVGHQLLHGGTPVPTREEMVGAFQAGEVPVFLLSLKAGGTGLNLTRADHVVHLDRWWNPAVEEQATDRAYRIGQTRPVQVHRMVVQGTVEERIGELLARKRTLADAVLGGGEAALTELGDAELRDLVTLRPP